MFCYNISVAGFHIFFVYTAAYTRIVVKVPWKSGPSTSVLYYWVPIKNKTTKPSSDSRNSGTNRPGGAGINNIDYIIIYYD